MRGQTTLDFALGISIFIVVILFVFTFVPGLLDPFALNSEEDTVLVGQLADRLAQDTLGDPTEPFILDRSCTVAFFANKTPGRCRYGGDTLHDRLNIPSSQNVNITIERNATVGSSSPDTLCWDDSGKELVAADNTGACDTELTAGESPRSGGQNPATITARRVVSLAGEDVTMKVVVW